MNPPWSSILTGANADDGHPTRATADPLQQQDTPASPQATEPSSATRSSDDLAAQPQAGDSHGDGHVADTAAQGAQAAAGSGYDRYAYASLAPVSLKDTVQPALADQLRRCLTTPLPAAVSLSVIVDGAGGFVDAYRADDGASVPLREPEAIALATAALKRCSPYRDLHAGLGHPLRLDLAAGPAT